MANRLILLTGPDAGREYPLNFTAGPVVFGRSHQHANYALPDGQMSRVHFQIELRGGDIWVTDLASTAGTLVNGRKIAEHLLRPGDVIRAGETQLRFLPEGMTSAPAPAPAGERLENLIGQAMGNYTVGPLLARGASGCVFRATDSKTGQVVALKVLFPELARSDEEMQRFVRAMKTIMPLCHPNLIMLLGAGKAQGLCWMAMELVEGESLAQLIRRVGQDGRLDWRFAMRVGVHVTRALNYADQQSVLHRNITPNNILVRSSDQVALLGDLMLAKALEGSLAAQITKPGELIGELGYMSPERTHGTMEVDGRSDLYSLGATLYALLTGKPPHEGLTLVETIQKIRNHEPRRPRALVPTMPEELDGVIMKMLATKPAARFQSAAEVMARLERLAKLHGVAV